MILRAKRKRKSKTGQSGTTKRNKACSASLLYPKAATAQNPTANPAPKAKPKRVKDRILFRIGMFGYREFPPHESVIINHHKSSSCFCILCSMIIICKLLIYRLRMAFNSRPFLQHDTSAIGRFACHPTILTARSILAQIVALMAWFPLSYRPLLQPVR